MASLAYASRFSGLNASLQTRLTTKKNCRVRLSPIKAETSYFNVEEAVKAVKEDGYTVLDIRDQSQFDRAHIKNSVHIPLFVENTDTDIGTAIKRQAHNNFAGLLYGLAFTKPNEAFLKTVEEKFSKDSKILLVCQEGLRSGTAISQLENVGYDNLALLISGLNTVPNDEFPTSGERLLKDAGKGGFVSIQTQFSIVLGAFLITLWALLEFFPDASKDVLKALYNLGN